MRNRLQVITKSWHMKSASQPKILVSSDHQFIKLSHKRNQNFNNLTQQPYDSSSKHQNLNSQHRTKKLVSKLNTFILKIEETLKKILYQKDIKAYIVYAHTSETQIMDNFSRALDKFKRILYELKQKPYWDEKTSQSTSSIIKSQEEVLSAQSKLLTDKKKELKKINYDVLEFVLQYFQNHMIPETHWSIKKKQAGKNQQTNFFSSFLDKFKLNCQTQSEDAMQIKSQLHLTRTMTTIVQQINKEQRQSTARNGLKGQQKQIFAKPIEETLNAILKIQEMKPIQSMTSLEKIAYLLDLESKIFVSSEFVQSAAFFQDDITTLPRQKYEKAWDYIHENDMGDQKTITEEYRLMKMLMIITNASVIKQLEFKTQEDSWFRKIIFGLSFPRYFVDYGKAKLQNHKFLRKPNVQTTKSIWNLPQNGFIKQLKKPFIFDSIKCNLQFYVPRTNSKKLSQFKNRKYDQNLDIWTPKQNTFRVRLLNYKQLDVGNRKNENVYDTIVIHYHGGGFIALSSCTSQSYTRKWANALRVPVFSVDYGKPPDFRFPTPVLDCLDAYNFISTQIHKHVNIRPTRIFVAGDSAGGNLACSLTALTLKLQMQVPSGLLLAYPAVDTRTRFTPSRINSFNDVILYPTLLLLCMQQYLGQYPQNQTNPLASPILLTEDYISDNGSTEWPVKWPKTIIMVGKKDPLYDDSLRLCQRLASSNIQFHCQIYKKFSHAFLSIDKMLPQCTETIKDSIRFFEKLMEGNSVGRKRLL